MSSASLHQVRDTPSASAAETLYERFYDRIYGFCLYQLGNREEAEDAAQTTFLAALGALERGAVPRSDAPWIFTIARNTCRARFRSRGLSRAREQLADPKVLEAVAPGATAGGEELFSLSDALADMPELQRRAILMREWRGCSYAEIAEELGLSASAVETLIFRARRSLAQRLEHPARLSGLGSFVAALKGVLGIGSAAKVGVAVSVAALAIGLGVPSDVEQRPSAPVSPGSTRVVWAPAPTSPTPGEKPARRPRAEPKPAGSEKTDRPSSPGTVAPPAVADPLAATLDPVTDDLNATVDGLEDVVDDVVGGTVNPLLPPELRLPGVEVPDVRLPDLLG